MASLASSISQPPCASQFASHSEATQLVGRNNPVELPVILAESFEPTIGAKIGYGDCSAAHAVKGRPDRVYKIMAASNFGNGNEVHIAKMAAQLDVGPAFYGAYLVEQAVNARVVIEMGYAGKTLRHWSVEFDEAEALPITNKIISYIPNVIQRLATGGAGSSQPLNHVWYNAENQPLLEKIIGKLGLTLENFYFELFSKLKTLAEHNIAYIDTHWGNIIPATSCGTRFQLIDFDAAKFMPSTQEAAHLAGAISGEYLRAYDQLANLSQESRALIAWFRGHGV